MKTQFITAAMLVLALAVQAPAQDEDAKRSAAEKKAIAAIKKLGGRVVSVAKNSGKADYVFFNSTNVTDAGLVHLKALTNLHNLDLSTTKITDAGLVHLKGSAKLRTLYLEDIKVTDAGLVHLKGLTGLQHLHLGGANVTNAGLLHLKGLTKLQYLYLLNTEVGDAGLAHLKGLTKLEALNLYRTKVGDDGLGVGVEQRTDERVTTPRVADEQAVPFDGAEQVGVAREATARCSSPMDTRQSLPRPSLPCLLSPPDHAPTSATAPPHPDGTPRSAAGL